MARRWLDQTSQPNARAEYVLGVAGLVAAGTRAKGRQDRAVAPVPSHGQVVQAKFGQRTTQLPQWRNGGIGAGHMAERVIIKCQVPAFEQWPWDLVGGQPAGKTIGFERAAFINPIVEI